MNAFNLPDNCDPQEFNLSCCKVAGMGLKITRLKFPSLGS